MRLNRRETIEMLNDARSKLPVLLVKQTETVNLLEAVQIRRRILMAHQPYLVKQIEDQFEKERKCSKLLKKYTDESRRLLACIFKCKKELRILAEVNQNNLYDEDNDFVV